MSMQFTQGSNLHQTYFATLDDVVIISADNATINSSPSRRITMDFYLLTSSFVFQSALDPGP